ncbi:MAG: GDP-mannose-dependent alpha-(1-6)-phosphatidylinositol monomannoside mannosyltransferase [Chlamydiae bacterium]|nr:GDP-mannose-dependent alpha-(1-6)-phosphatidylinositol monomannoside mannosyltransferase [Chlamydiota bacterium]
MKKRPQLLFADRLPPLVGGVEMHAGAFIRYFREHSTYPIARVIEGPVEKTPLSEAPSILFFNSGRWIEQMPLIRRQYPSASIIYRTGGNEIIKASLDCCLNSHQRRQAIWIKTLNGIVDLMITNSAFTENRLRDLGLTVPFARCVGGVDSILSSSNPRQTSKSLCFFSAARFVPYKNHHLLIAAFNELHRRGREFSLFLAGDGSLLEKAQSDARGNPKIVFFGRCDNQEILRQMVEADVYVQLSSDYETEVPGGSYIHTEGMGRSILEAISVGTYVIAGRCGALDEIVTPERGELIPLNSFHEIVKSLEAILNSPPERRPLTDAFNWNYLFKRYENLYESLNHH